MELHFDEIADNNGSSKKTVTYDDILAKLNVKIVDGRMQYITPVGITNDHFKAKPSSKSTGMVGAPQAVDKTSYIYNKYFKNEKFDRPMRSPPKSREEYNRRLAEEMRKHALAQQQMRQAKSKKLSFHANNNYGRASMVDPDTLFRINLKR
jgi:hypothetical protein